MKKLKKINIVFIALGYAILNYFYQKKHLHNDDKLSIVELYHSFLLDFIQKDEIQVPNVLSKLLNCRWNAYVTRPIKYINEYRKVNFIPIGKEITNNILKQHPGLYTYKDETFLYEYASYSAKYGNFLFTLFNGSFFDEKLLLAVIKYKFACKKLGYKNSFFYIKMDMPLSTLEQRIEDVKSGNYFKYMYKKTILKATLNYIDCVSFESELSTNKFQQFVESSKCNIITVYNAPPEELVNFKINQSVRKKSILSVARFGSWHKSSENLIKAYSQVEKNHSDWELWLLGDMTEDFKKWLFENYENLINSNKIKLLGFSTDYAFIAELYSSCGIYTLPSRFEGASFSLVEAAYFGCPIICTPVGSAYDVLGELFEKNTVDIDNYQQLADSFENLILDDDKRKEVSEYLENRAMKLFNWEYQLQKVADITKSKMC